MALVLDDGVPLGSSLEYQRGWLVLRRIKTARAWFLICPAIQALTFRGAAIQALTFRGADDGTWCRIKRPE